MSTGRVMKKRKAPKRWSKKELAAFLEVFEAARHRPSGSGKPLEFIQRVRTHLCSKPDSVHVCTAFHHGSDAPRRSAAYVVTR